MSTLDTPPPAVVTGKPAGRTTPRLPGHGGAVRSAAAAPSARTAS
ncbi:hypothetical protein WJ438_29290 [Streptomyces sp. GD-15H]